MSEEIKTNLENTCVKMGILHNKLFTNQGAGEPFYIINIIENNICSFVVHAALIDNEITPFLFLDKSLAETFIKLFYADRQVTSLSNFDFNVVYSIKNEQSICIVATRMDNQGNLVLKVNNLKEIRKIYNLKTTDELKSILS